MGTQKLIISLSRKEKFYDEFENTITMLHKKIDSKSQTEAMLGLAEQVFICSM